MDKGGRTLGENPIRGSRPRRKREKASELLRVEGVFSDKSSTEVKRIAEWRARTRIESACEGDSGEDYAEEIERGGREKGLSASLAREIT